MISLSGSPVNYIHKTLTTGPSIIAPPGGAVYATWNSADKAASVTLSNGNLTSSAYEKGGVRATLSKAVGKWFFEFTIGTLETNRIVGVATGNIVLTDDPAGQASFWCYDGVAGSKRRNGSPLAYGDTWGTGSVIGVALDLDAGKIWFAKNGVWQASGDPAAGTNEAWASVSGTLFPYCNGASFFETLVVTANFGATAFTGAVPAGFNAGWYML